MNASTRHTPATSLLHAPARGCRTVVSTLLAAAIVLAPVASTTVRAQDEDMPDGDADIRKPPAAPKDTKGSAPKKEAAPKAAPKKSSSRKDASRTKGSKQDQPRKDAPEKGAPKREGLKKAPADDETDGSEPESEADSADSAPKGRSGDKGKTKPGRNADGQKSKGGDDDDPLSPGASATDEGEEDEITDTNLLIQRGPRSESADGDGDVDVLGGAVGTDDATDDEGEEDSARVLDSVERPGASRKKPRTRAPGPRGKAMPEVVESVRPDSDEPGARIETRVDPTRQPDEVDSSALPWLVGGATVGGLVLLAGAGVGGYFLLDALAPSAGTITVTPR